MLVRSLLKNNKGSTLMLSILIIIIMSLLGISLMAITLSSMNMSIFYSDLDKAYSLAEAAAEEIISNIDQKVADIQEESRAQASEYLKLQLKENPISLREPSGEIALATSDPSNVSKLEQAYELKYFEYFYSGLGSEFGDLKFDDARKTDKLMELLGTTMSDGIVVYKDLGTEKGRLILKNAQYDSINHTVTIAAAGLYNGYEKKIGVTIVLLADKDNTPYQPIEYARIKKPVKYDILKKAIVTEKNMVATGGYVEITGDVLSFGTVPVNNTTQDEDQNANWYQYGGIMVGMCQDVADVSNTEFGFDSSKTGTHNYGRLKIIGNAATMGYIHSIYSTSIDTSTISITGDTYARSLRSERTSNYSTIELNNLSTLDNLQIDSNGSQVTINGVYKGIVDTWHAIGGSDGAGTIEDSLVPKRTSSVVVNGDSMLKFMNAIYIGGSTFFKNIVDTRGYPYMSGISILKSTSRVKNAFMKDEPSNPTNKLFWYVGNGNAEDLDNDGYLEEIAGFTSYNMGTQKIDMFSGRASNPRYFPLVNRAMHFKKVWTNLWENDFENGYSTYINAENITIAGKGITSDGKLRGYSNGAIIANGTVYDSYDFENIPDSTEFHSVQKEAIKQYYAQVGGLLMESYNESLPKLNFVEPTKTINTYIDENFIGTNRIVPNEPYVSSNTGLGFVYYGTTDVEIKKIAGNWYINDKIMPSTKGIIYVDGNIYVGSDFNFTGTLMSSKNIVFLGNANVAYDQNTIDGLLGADVNINGFFGLLTYEIPEETLESQRISTKNTKIVKWNEIK